MKHIKNNKGIAITLLIILIFIIAGIFLLKAFFPSGNAYGDRLKGIEKVEFSKSEITKLEEKIKERDNIKNVSIDIKGRLINIIITVNKDTNIDDMKDYAKERLEIFDKEELEYYDVQFYLLNEDDESEDYPSIGYKHKTSDEIKWSNN
ncbi:MAG: hypothetical protein J6K23_06580 [Bacilli bacterium]|nr:hypothetical protein [Bacilli bacterium]MBP3445582.1 hypothetical protein [Bacilli bacterium]